MSKITRNIVLILLAVLLVGSFTGFLTVKGCESINGEVENGYTLDFSTNINVADDESATIYLSVNGGAYESFEFTENVDDVQKIYAEVNEFSIYFAPSNPENVRLSSVTINDVDNDISTATSATTAKTFTLTANSDIVVNVGVLPGFTVNANAVLSRHTGSAGGLLFVSVNGGEFEQFADLTAMDPGTTKTVTEELTEVYALAFYTTVNDDSLLTSATYDFGGSGEDFGESTSPATATVLTISEETEINFDLLFRPFGYSVTLDQLATGNTSSGVSISIDGGTFTNYYGNQDDVLIEQYATTLDFYFIYDAATVDEKTAVYYYYDEGEEVEVNFVNSTHENPVHIDLTANFTLITETYANIEQPRAFTWHIDTTKYWDTTDTTVTTYDISGTYFGIPISGLEKGGHPPMIKSYYTGGPYVGATALFYNGGWPELDDTDVYFSSGTDLGNQNLIAFLETLGTIEYD